MVIFISHRHQCHYLHLHHRLHADEEVCAHQASISANLLHFHHIQATSATSSPHTLAYLVHKTLSCSLFLSLLSSIPLEIPPEFHRTSKMTANRRHLPALSRSSNQSNHPHRPHHLLGLSL